MCAHAHRMDFPPPLRQAGGKKKKKSAGTLSTRAHCIVYEFLLRPNSVGADYRDRT